MKNLLSINPFLFRYRHLLAGGIFFVIISNLFTLYPAQIFRMTLDLIENLIYVFSVGKGMNADSLLPALIGSTALMAGILVLLAAVMRGVFLFFTRQTIIMMSRHIEYDQKNQLYHHYQNMSRAFFRKYSTGDMMSRISEDVGKVRMYTGPGIMYTINTLTLFVMVIVTMLMVNVELTIYSVLPLPLLCFAIYKVESVVTRKSEKIQEKLSDMTAFTQETYSGIRSVKSYVREEALTDLFSRESEEYRDKSMQLVQVNALFYPSIVFLIGLSTLITMWIGGEQVIKGKLSTGNIAEFIIYVNLLVWPVASLGWISTMIQQAGASQGRINDYLREKSELVFPEQGQGLVPGNAFRLEFKEVSYTYPETGIRAVRNLNFTLEPGKTLAIIGKTGSGKSTLASLILRLQDPDSGTIYVNGKNLKEFDRQALRQSIGYVPQDVLLFSESISDNISFGLPDAGPEKIRAAAEFSALLDNIESFPKGFDTMVGEKGVTLSGGQKQRVSLARAVIKEPSLLILDDALSAVDTRTEDAILNSLLDLQKKPQPPSVILISHRISTVRYADQILVMDQGRIAEAGTHAELMERNGLYAEIHRLQLLEAELKTV